MYRLLLYVLAASVVAAAWGDRGGDGTIGPGQRFRNANGELWTIMHRDPHAMGWWMVRVDRSPAEGSAIMSIDEAELFAAFDEEIPTLVAVEPDYPSCPARSD